MSTRRAPTHRDDESDDIPPPYTLVPTDGVSLQFGPARPFQPPPQQPRLPQLRQPSPELSDFARDFYATGRAPSRSLEDVRQPPPRPQTQNSAPDDGRPTRSPVPGHPLLNNGKTLVYPQGYECSKCHNTGYKSFDPSHPCRKCWEKYSKPYSGPIIYASWNDGPSNRQRPLLNPRSSTSTPSLARSISSIVNQARNDLSSIADNPARRSLPPPSSSSAVYPPRRSHPSPFPPPLPPRPRSDFVRASVWSTSSSTSTSTCHRSAPPPTAVLRPGDPRIGGRPCWNCSGSGRTLGFLLLSDRMCDVCAGLGRLF